MAFSAMGGNYSITSGMVMIPFMFGVGIIFYNSKNPLGWILALGSLTGLIFGVISSIRFSMSNYDSLLNVDCYFSACYGRHWSCFCVRLRKWMLLSKLSHLYVVLFFK